MSDEELPAVIQPSLFSELELDLIALDQPETRKRYTASSLEQRVRLRDAIVRCLAEGHGLLRIARTFGVSHHLVSALRDARPDLVAIEKKAMSQQVGKVAKMMLDSIEERLANGTLKPGSVDVAIMLDKKAMLDGDAGLVVEHRLKVDASASGFMARLRAAVDSESTATGQNGQQKDQIIDVQTVADTAGQLGTGMDLGPAPGAGADGGTGGGAAPAPVPPATPTHPADGGK